MIFFCFRFPVVLFDSSFFLSFFLFCLTSLSRLFHSYREEPIGRWGETGVPRENHLTHPQAELGLSHMWPVWFFLADQGSPFVMQHVVSVESSSLLLIVLKRDLFVYHADSLTS